MKTINDRYEVVRLLSRGNNEIEYLVVDLDKNKQQKRMRIFDAEMSNSQFVKNMEEEFIVLKNMSHENILTVYEFQTIRTINSSPVSRKQYFYTYEHWEEEERVSYLELGKSEINSVLVGLCKALRYLHFRGIIYKYLNFDQMIILRKDKRVLVKLKDVAGNGINDYYYNADYERFNHFLAPEILWGEEIDETVDIYSLGTVFFYIYYQIDHYYRNIKEVIHTDASNDIHLFISKATSAIREERFQNIGAFIEKMSGLIWTEVDHYDYIYYDKIHRHTKIAGRDAIVSEVRDYIESKHKKTGDFDAVIIKGDSGTGKTRVLKEMAQISKFNRFDYIFIRIDAVAENPYLTARKILAHIQEKDDVSPVLIQKYGQELISLSPELADHWNIKQTEVIDTERDYLRILNRIYNFFIEYTASNFTVIIVDEVGRIHSKERVFYEMLMSGKEASNYFLLFSCNQWQLEHLNLGGRVKTIKLPSLTLEETGALVKTALGCKAIPYHLTHKLMLESQGKVSKIETLLWQLWEDKYIFFDREKMDWNLERIDDQFSFDHVEKRDFQYDVMLKSLKEPYVDLLKKLSVITHSFNFELVVKYGEVDEETAYHFLTEMESEKILNKRISDVEYVFVFFSNELRKYFVNLVAPDARVGLYEKLTGYYEKLFIERGVITESIVDYCINCGRLEKAAQYCITYSKRYAHQFNYPKSSELMEKGIELYKRLNREDHVLEYALLLIQQLIKSGRLEAAARVVDAMATYENFLKPAYIDIITEKAYVLYYKSDYTGAMKLLEKTALASAQIDYKAGQTQATFVMCKCLAAVGNYEEHFFKYAEGYDMARELESPFYIGLFLNEKGIHYLHQAKYAQALEAFSESLKAFQSVQKDEFTVRAFNNIGAVHYEGFGDFIIAREYFRKAHHLSQSISDSMNMPTQLSNLGETYQAEERHEMAIRYYEQANQVAERIGDRAMMLQALLNLCASYIGNENYSKAHILMARLEHEHASVLSGRGHAIDYYFLHFDYFMAMNAHVSLIKWRADAPELHTDDSYKSYRLKVFDFRIAYLQSKKDNTCDHFDLSELSAFVKQIEKPLLAKHMRMFLLEMMYDKLADKDYLSVAGVARLDDLLIPLYNTKTVRVKREIVDACFSEYPVERMLMVLKDMEGASNEMMWRTYHIIADLFCVKGDLYNALKYNLMALDIIFQLSMRVSQVYKDSYILHDDNKIRIKDHINKIVASIVEAESMPHCDGIVEHVPSLEMYFDLSGLDALYRHPRFERMIVEKRPMIFENRFVSATDLIQNLKKDEIRNLKLILSYLTQLTFSDRGTVYILDENDFVSESVVIGDGEPYRDLPRLINNVGNDMDGYYISRLNPLTSVKLLNEQQKGLLFIPVYEQETVPSGTQRREDLLILKKKIAGYVLLESFSVVHRLNDDVLEKAKRFMNLFYVFIDNYNLKRVSAIDKLTGVYLRKYIEQQFAVQLSVARQNNDSLSVMMLDIDKFKNVNDTYGHRKGDEILTHLGDILKNSVRSSDYVARYGGEEFIVLLPETHAKEAYKVAEKIRERVEERKLLGDGKKLTVSIGVSTYPKDGSNEDELIEKADQALYYSKNNGRNQSTSWDEHLIKEGHRYDKLTGILTGNISADTRNVQAMLDVVNQLKGHVPKTERVLNMFVSILDITEGEAIQYVRTSATGEVIEALSKRKGRDKLERRQMLSDRLVKKFSKATSSSFFIDWGEKQTREGLPDWKSYIVIHLDVEEGAAFMAIAVRITDKEFDFSNYNFVETLNPIVKRILLES